MVSIKFHRSDEVAGQVYSCRLMGRVTITNSKQLNTMNYSGQSGHRLTYLQDSVHMAVQLLASYSLMDSAYAYTWMLDSDERIKSLTNKLVLPPLQSVCTCDSVCQCTYVCDKLMLASY